MSEFLEYARKNQHSGNCTRAEAFTMGQKSQQAKIDELQKQLIDQGQRFNEQSQKLRDSEFKCDELHKLVQSLRSEYDLWGNCPQADRQIELLEKSLRR